MNILNKIFISVDITNVEGVQDYKKWSPNGHHILNHGFYKRWMNEYK